jgi:hypothetical protein
LKLKFNFNFKMAWPDLGCYGVFFMRIFTTVFLITGLLGSAAAAQEPQPSHVETGHAPSQTRDAVSSQVDRLTALVEQQQKQIEQLQKSQAELLQEIRAQKGATPAPQGAAAPSTDTAAVGAPAAQAPASTQASTYDAPKERGIALGDRVRIGGYGSVRYETNNVKSGNNIPGGSANGFTFRRLVVTTDARPTSRLRIYSELEFERLLEIETEKSALRAPGELTFKQTMEGNPGGAIELEQAWGQYDFAKNHGFRGGIMLVPVGRFNLLHDDDYWDIPRRTLTDRDGPVLPVKSAWRDLGAGFVGSFSVGRTGKLDYQVMALNGASLDFNVEHELVTKSGSPGESELVLNSELQLGSGFFDGSKSTSAFAWRTSYSPNLHGEFAFSGYHGTYNPTFLDFGESLTSLAYDHKWKYKNFETEGELVYTSLGNLNRVINSFAVTAFNSANTTVPSSSSGGMTSATVETELANMSRDRVGFWSDFKYHARPKWLKRSFLGRDFEDPQIIPIVRYERIWLNRVTDKIEVANGVVTGLSQEDLQQERFTAGISYRPALQFAIQAAFEHNRKINGSRLIFPAVDQDSTNGLILGMSFAF